MISKAKNPWKTLSSKIAYKSRIIKVYEDEVIRPDGTKGIYSYTSVPRTVGIVPIDTNSSIYLCKQFRYIFKDESWEIPRGFIDKGERPIDAAIRELAEEAKLTAKTINPIGSLRLSSGLIDEEVKIFIAQNVLPAKLAFDNEKEIAKVERFSLGEILEMIKKSKLVDGLTVAAILKAKEILNLG